MALANLNTYCTWKSIKSAYNNNAFKISAPTWNDEFNFLDGSYSFQTFKITFSALLKNMKR